MAQIAIKGHATRGKEVIEILEMLGGVNKYEISDAGVDLLYTIRSYDKFIIGVYPTNTFIIFTLEEFLEKFPYKVGDKVLYHDSKAYIKSMKWGSREIIYTVEWEKELWETTVFYLQPYKEETMDKAVFAANAQCCDIMNHLIKKETMEGKIESFEVLESHCTNEVKIEFDPSKFEIVKRDNGYYVVKKQPQYPKTYEECCKVLFPNSIELGKVLTSGYNCELLKKLGELLICRDAYWKIAGEQMGLGEPWKPDWKELKVIKYTIQAQQGYTYTYYDCSRHHVLSFPTRKMRDAFYENFKDLIEACKELL